MNIFLIQLFFLVVFMHVGFFYAVVKKRNDIADVFWGLGFVLLSGIGFL